MKTPHRLYEIRGKLSNMLKCIFYTIREAYIKKSFSHIQAKIASTHKTW